MLSDATDDNPIRDRDRALADWRITPVESVVVVGTADSGRTGEFFADKVEIHLPLTARTRR